MVAVAPRRGAHRPKRVRAGARFGQSKRADLSARAEIGKIFAALCFVPVSVDVVCAQIVVRHPGQRHRMVPASKPLKHEAG